MVKKLTPVLFVDKIEPVLPFWTEHLGFVKTVEVPDGDRLAFVILQQGTVEVMYQTYASVDKDLPAILPDVRKGPTFLYIEVENLDATGDSKIVTIAVWEDEQAFSNAKLLVQEHYKKIGFNPGDIIKRLGIEADMDAYTRLAL